LYGAGFAFFERRLELETRAAILTVQGALGALFYLYLLLASNPFARLNPAPLNGAGLNPLLQDVGLVLHPPLLYFGYVGFSLSFSVAVAALVRGELAEDLAGVIRRWALIAWVALTLGIGFGAWWSYYTLGWGGWWAWDPVENAALMPWLAGTALLHSATVAVRRGALKSWSVFLAIVAFGFALLGTFLVRSGVITSVHAFANDPGRGILILIMMALIVGAALVLFAARAGRLKDDVALEPLSDEGGILAGGLILAVAAGTVLIGTLYPLILDGLHLGQVSVGPPYFNIIFLWLLVPFIALMVVTPGVEVWRRHRATLPLAVLVAIVVAVVAGLAWGASWPAGLLGGVALLCLSLFPARKLAAGFAHGGMAVLLAGIALTSALSSERLIPLHPGQTASFAGYTLRLIKVEGQPGTNYDSTRANISIRRNGNGFELAPELRQYRHPAMAKAVPAIHTDIFADIYAVLGGEADGVYSLHLFYRPGQVLIFAGMILMVLGGLLALVRRRSNVPQSPSAQRTERPHTRLVPLAVFAVLVGLLFWQLLPGKPDAQPSALLIGNPVPDYSLPALAGTRPVMAADLKGRVRVVNFFASWCVPCRTEAGALQLLARNGVPIVGIAYRDKPDDTRRFLTDVGNPYAMVGRDDNGRAAIDFGLTGVPETFLIDASGTVRFKYAGPLTADIVRTQILPRAK
ncbi:MAG: DsbE family thiol:disulfide interchange protein, partial [Rhizomicrobium sp.]